MEKIGENGKHDLLEMLVILIRFEEPDQWRRYTCRWYSKLIQVDKQREIWFGYGKVFEFICQLVFFPVRLWCFTWHQSSIINNSRLNMQPGRQPIPKVCTGGCDWVNLEKSMFHIVDHISHYIQWYSLEPITLPPHCCCWFGVSELDGFSAPSV